MGLVLTPTAVFDSGYGRRAALYEVTWSGAEALDRNDFVFNPAPAGAGKDDQYFLMPATVVDVATHDASIGGNTFVASNDWDGTQWLAGGAGAVMFDVPAGDYVLAVDYYPKRNDGLAPERLPAGLAARGTSATLMWDGTKPTGLTYFSRGTNGGYPAVVYRIDDASAQSAVGFENTQQTLTVEPPADGFDNNVVPQDGGVAADGTAPGLLGEYMLWTGSEHSEADEVAATGWNPFDLAYRPGLVLPTLSSLIAIVLAAPVTDPNGSGDPLPGHPGLIYEKFWEPDSSDARLHIGPVTSGVEYARYDADSFAALLASGNHIELDLSLGVTDPYEMYLYSTGYNVPNNSTSDPVSPNATISGHVYLYDHGPVINNPADGNYGYDAWTNSTDATYPDIAIPPPANYSWPGEFGLITGVGGSGGGATGVTAIGGTLSVIGGTLSVVA